MKIYVVGSSKNKFLPLDNIREKFLIDQPHEGDNIDFLNPWYCELTGLYYLWKHVDDEIVGLEHYRRYFINDKRKLLSESEIREILKTNDIIAYRYYGQNGVKALCNSGKGKSLALALAIVNVYYGSDVAKFFKNKLSGKYTSENNMFICKKEIINEYCAWLFTLLKLFDENDTERIPRIDGYIAEYFFGPYLEWKQYRIKLLKRKVFNKEMTKELHGHV